MTDVVAFKSVRDLRSLLVGRQISPLELVDLFLSRIEHYGARSKAFITVTSEVARAEAARLRRDDMTSFPFAGIPYASKDLFDVEGVVTTGGSRVLHDNLAERDAFAVARLRAARAVSLGKTNLHEFAYGATGENSVYGTCVNAYDDTRLAGGSSSGSAAAVAFGLVPAALGTDTGGSVRAPAALNGLVGLKPTIGRVSTAGVFPYCWTLDHVGLITRTVADSADLLRIVAGHDVADPGSSTRSVPDYCETIGDDIFGMRIGIPTNFFYERVDPEILSALDQVKTYLSKRGAVLVPIAFPDIRHSRTVSLTIQMPEALSAHSAYLQKRGDLYSEEFRAGLALGQFILAEHYVKAKRFVEFYRNQTDALFENVDVILTPATPEIAQKLGTVTTVRDGIEEAVGNAITRFTTFFNMTGHPALTMPCAMHSLGLPIGLQFVGPYFKEGSVLRVARAVETAEEFRIPVPPL